MPASGCSRGRDSCAAECPGTATTWFRCDHMCRLSHSLQAGSWVVGICAQVRRSCLVHGCVSGFSDCALKLQQPDSSPGVFRLLSFDSRVSVGASSADRHPAVLCVCTDRPVRQTMFYDSMTAHPALCSVMGDSSLQPGSDAGTLGGRVVTFIWIAKLPQRCTTSLLTHACRPRALLRCRPCSQAG